MTLFGLLYKCRVYFNFVLRKIEHKWKLKNNYNRIFT